MSEWTIYHNDNTELTVVKELEYHDEWMADGYVSVTVKSATPVGFSIGDYLEYRGERFEINYDPNLIKRAKSGSYGDGFVYENVKLYSQSARMKDVGFLDYVLNWDSASNKNVYSSQGTFAFYAESVEDLADRIQANLDRHSNGEWLVLTPNWSRSSQRGATTDWWTGYFDGTWGGAIRTEGKTDVSVSADNLSCRDALNLSYTAFDLSYYVTSKTVTSGQTSTTKKLVIIGGKSVSASHIFKYGKGNGLYEIERTSDDSERIITKLFAYGSDKNLPLNFYANIGKKMFFTLVTKTSRTIIMGNDTLLLWTNIPWTDKLDNAFAPSYYGVRLEYTNQSQQYFAATFGVMGDTYTFGDEKDDDSTILDHTTKYLVFYILSSHTGAESFYGAVSADSKIYITSGVNLNKLPESMIETPLVYDYPALLSISKLMLPGFPSQSLFAWVVNHGATNIDYNNYKAKWHGHTAYFSTDPHNPWIMSLRADEIGVREGTVNFDGSAGEDEIYPTIEGRSDGYNNRADAVAWAEQMDDNGYLGENPKDSAKLFKFKPNMVDGIFIDWTDNDGDVAVTMNDGPCVGREFKMNSAKLNDDGDWEITLERQQDTSLLRYFPYKEPDSDKLFQVLGSENVISGADVNHFIVTGINLPESFVENASQKLLEKALEQLDKKDHQSFTYLPKVDEIYMKRQDDAVQAGRDAATYGTVSLHDTLRAGMQMRIKDTDLDIDYRPFIDVLTIKENGNNGIPTYDVVLRDNKELTMQQRIQSQIEGGKDAILNLGGDGSSYPLTSEFLSRLKDDEAKGLITFLKGLQVGDRFVTGLLGEGGIFRKDADGKTYIEADKLYIRMKAYFDTVEVRKFIHSGGNRIASPAGGKCVRVEYMAQYNGQWVVVDENGVYTWRDSQGVKHTATPPNGIEKIRCYFRGEDDGMTVTNDWQVGDQAYCKVTNERLNMHMFWRLVIGTSGNTLTDDGEFWIDLSNKDTESITSVTYAGKMDGSDLPIAQDSIVQLGNVDDPDRRGAIIEFVTAENSPSYQIFQNLGEPAPAGSSTSEMKAAQFSYDDKYYIGFGFNSETNRAYMDVYGDFFFGAKEDPVTGESPTYIRYTQEDEETGQPKLEIKAVIEASSPVGGTEVPTTIGDILNDIDDLQSQIDGSIETWFEDYMPVSSIESTVPLLWLDNAHTIPCLPYKDWYDADVAADNNNERLRHLGDVFYDNTSGYAFRFSNTGTSASPVFSWVLITDSAVVEALKIANSKNKVISTTAGTLPTPPYETGDLWVNATGTFTYTEQGQTHSVTYDNDILRCINAKARGESASITDWILASRYTDDTVVEHYMDILAGGVSPTKQDKEAALAAERAIRTALGGKTIIEGGLMLTSIIGMRKLNHPQDDPDDPDNYTTYAGLSGVYDTNLYGGGIAAWYGGSMVDKRDSTTGEYTVVNGAKSGFRFDGSGWLADGNIFWDAAGSVTIKNITTLSDSQNTNILNELATFNSAFSFSTSGSGSGQTVISITPNVPFTSLSILDTSVSPNVGRPVATQKWVEDNFMTIAAFETLFNAINSSGNKVNHPYSSAVASIKAMFGLWTDQYLSAKGLNSSGGSGGVGDVTWDLLANSSDTRPIALSHLTTALSSYATQSWVSSQGYLTSIPTASASTKGGVKVGNTLAISSEVLNLASVTITAPATGDTTYTKVYVDGYGRVTKATTLSDIDIPSLAASKITSGTLDAARIPNLSWTKITTDKPTTLSGYGITDGVKNDTTWWGRSISSGAVKGSIEKATSLEFDNIGSSANNGGYIDFHYNGDNTSNSGDYTSRIIEDQSGIIKINNTLFAKLSGGVTIGTSTVGSNYKLEVSGEIGLTGSTKRIYFSDINHYIELDSNGYFHFSHGLYSDSFVSAKGLNSSGGGSIDLNQPLSGINSAGLSAPSTGGQAIVWNGSAWTYSINTTLRAGAIATTGGASIYGNVESTSGNFIASAGHGYTVSGKDNTYVLLAGGGTKLLSEIGGGSYVTSVGVTDDTTNHNWQLRYVKDNVSTYFTPPYAERTKYIHPCTIPDTYAYHVCVKIGQPSIGSANGCAYRGSSNNANLWSFPDGATAVNTNNSVNIQNMRFYWSSQYFHDIYMSPNNNYVFHRSVDTGHATDWYMIPQFLYVKNAIGVGSASRPVYVNGSGEIVAANEYSLDNIPDGTTRKLADYLPLSGGTMANTNLVTNLNAEYLQGYSVCSYNKPYNKIALVNVDGVMEVGKYLDFHPTSDAASTDADFDHAVRIQCTTRNKVTVTLPSSTGTLALTSDIPTDNASLTNGAGYITSSGSCAYATNAGTLGGYAVGSMVLDAGGNLSSSNKIYDIGVKRVFSGNNMPDAPVTGWVSGIVLGSNWNNNHFQHYLVEAQNGNWYTTRHYTSGSMDEWKQFAYITSNVASATKLQNERSLWGNTFNGSGDVTGSLLLPLGSSLSWLYDSSSIASSITRQNNSYTDYTKADMLFDAASWTSTNVTAFNFKTHDSNYALCIKNNGKVGIGTNAPSYNLDISGTLGVSGQITSSVAAGTAPITVTSTTMCTGLNANYLGGYEATSFYIQGAPSIELNQRGWLSNYGGFIDFHFNGSSADYTSRIIEDASGRININSIYFTSYAISNLNSIDSLLYFDRTNSRIGVGVSAPDYGIDAIGGMRLRNSTSGTGSFNCGVFSDSNNPYIRMIDLNGSSVDIKIATVTTQGNTIYPLSIGDIYRQTRIIGQNVRIYSRVDASSTQQTPAVITTYGGRVIIGSDTTLHTNNADCRMSVSGSLCTAEDDGTFIKIGQIYIGYDSSNTALKVYKKDSNNNIIAANFYATGAVSARGANTSGGGASDYIPLSGSTSITGNLTPSSNNSVNLGSSSKLWLGVYCTNLRAYGASSIGGNLTMAGSITPTADRQYSLGTESLRFAGLFIQGRIYLSGMNIQYLSAGSGVLGGYHFQAGSSDIILETSGYVWQRTTSQYYSDIRRKNIVSYIDTPVEKIADAPIFTFTWKDFTGNIQQGSSAQYWRDVLPCGTAESSNGILGMDYATTALVSAVVTARKVVNHEARIRLLEVENAALRNEINQLKKVA